MSNIDVMGNYRYSAPNNTPMGENVTVVANGDPGAAFDPATGTTQIELPDGAVTIAFGAPSKQRAKSDFDDNLAEDLDQTSLSAIAERLLQGIELDEQSRSAWMENIANGISLLGLEVKQPRGASAQGSTPAEGVSTVDHPLLLEAVLRFQANARGELLPSDGPVKVRNDGSSNALSDKLAQALEKDMNHYLTKVAKEYYPDTDRMLLMLGFSGIAFKKGYHDPIKRRPVVASIDAKDLIISNSATDVDSATRVTHRIHMRHSVLKRMQLLGAYLDIPLQAPATVNDNKTPVDQKIDEVQGIAPAYYIEETDRDRELFECYCEIELPGFEHTYNGEPTGLPLPYKVTLDRESRKILEIRRNWHEDDPFCLARSRIVAYIFIPGFGFYGIGLLNVLGNATKAVTAAWRLMIDAGMFSNFPGFLYLKSLAKQLTNQFRVPPGGGVPIDTVGNDIRSSVMPLPYKDPSAVFIQLIDNISTAAQRVGGTAELQIGEGKQDAPVGTTLAMIEQATKLMSAVHKRLHQAQGQEFDMLKSLLMEDPEALWRHNKKSAVLKYLVEEAGLGPYVAAQEQAETEHRNLFLTALADAELTPAADPNTSSQTERYLKVVAMRQMAQTNPNLDLNKIDEKALTTIGVDDPSSFFKPVPPPGSQPPSPEEKVAEATLMSAQARITEAQTKRQDAGVKAQTAQQDAQLQQQKLDSQERIAQTNLAKELIIHDKDTSQQARQLALDSAHRSADRIAGVQKEVLKHQQAGIANTVKNQQSMSTQAASLSHQAQQAALDRAHQHAQGVLDRQAQQGVAQGKKTKKS